VSRRLGEPALYPLDPPAIAHFLGSCNWLISKVRVSSPDRARDAIDLVAATVNAPAGFVEHASALMFIRVYVGLMFVPHFGSHILGGPFQFNIYTLYFASLGLFMPAAQVVLAGSVELISAVGLTLGLFTRPVALLASVYLLLSMLWGGHFQIGYVWALPEGGYEFGVFWAVMIAVFVVLGGGPLSVDNTMRRSDLLNRSPWLRAARLLSL
jgi:putative oxidoreductase